MYLWSLTLEELAKAIQIPISEILKSLQKADINAKNTDSVTVEEIASAHNLTPHQFFEKIKPQQMQATRKVVSGGYGRKNVEEICQDLKLPLSEGLAKLRVQGIAADGESNIRELASKNGKLPVDIVNILQGDGALELEIQ